MIVPLAQIAATSFVLSLSGAMMPGPVLTATITGTHRRGFWYGPGVVLGHALLEIPLLVAVIWSLQAAHLLRNPWVLVGIAVVGSAIVVWMGVGMIRLALGGSAETPTEGGRELGAVAAGMLTTAINPYWYLWWVTFPLVVIGPAVDAGWIAVLAFYVGHECGDLLWYTLVSFAVARGRRLLQGKLYKALLIGCAAVLFAMVPLFLKLAIEKGPSAGVDLNALDLAPAIH